MKTPFPFLLSLAALFGGCGLFEEGSRVGTQDDVVAQTPTGPTTGPSTTADGMVVVIPSTGCCTAGGPMASVSPPDLKGPYAWVIRSMGETRFPGTSDDPLVKKNTSSLDSLRAGASNSGTVLSIWSVDSVYGVWIDRPKSGDTIHLSHSFDVSFRIDDPSKTSSIDLAIPGTGWTQRGVRNQAGTGLDFRFRSGGGRWPLVLRRIDAWDTLQATITGVSVESTLVLDVRPLLANRKRSCYVSLDSTRNIRVDAQNNAICLDAPNPGAYFQP